MKENAYENNLYHLLELASENKGIVVCENPHELLLKAYEYNFLGITFISYNDFILNFTEYDKPFYIHELNVLCDSFSNIKAYTITLDEEGLHEI